VKNNISHFMSQGTKIAQRYSFYHYHEHRE